MGGFSDAPVCNRSFSNPSPRTYRKLSRRRIAGLNTPLQRNAVEAATKVFSIHAGGFIWRSIMQKHARLNKKEGSPHAHITRSEIRIGRGRRFGRRLVLDFVPLLLLPAIRLPNEDVEKRNEIQREDA